jgi:hypothetical protein
MLGPLKTIARRFSGARKPAGTEPSTPTRTLLLQYSALVLFLAANVIISGLWVYVLYVCYYMYK